MILGIGTDLANIERIAGTLDRFGDRFRNRVFTKVEQRKAERRKDTAGTYAKRWAAKEACSKALGTGLRMGIACAHGDRLEGYVGEQFALWPAANACHGMGRRAIGRHDARRARGPYSRNLDR